MTSQFHTLLFAHRGASAEAPENTIPAFERAVEVGADGVELDVHVTADGVLIVDHDGIFDGVPAVEYTRAELLKIAPHVPELSEVLDVVSSIFCNIEIKTVPLPGYVGHDPEHRTAHAVANVLQHHPELDRLIISSFDADALAIVRTNVPSATTGWLTAGISFQDALGFAQIFGHPWIHLHHEMLGTDPEAALVEAHDAGLLVNVWTVDQEARWEQLDGLVDVLITNDPHRFRQWKAQRW